MTEYDRQELKELFESLMNAPDFSAVRANARLEVHEAKCDERQISVLAAFNRMETGQAALHARLDKVSGRMWAAAATGLVLGIGSVASLIVLILTKGLK